MLDYDPYALLKPLPAFEVRSADVTDGEPIPREHVRPRLGRRVALAGAGVERVPARDEELRGDLLRSRRPDRLGLLALGGLQHPGIRHEPARGRRCARTGEPLPEGAITLPNEYRQTEFEGAGPPEGTGIHRYLLLVHAVDVPALELPEGCTPTVLAFNLHYHSLARARIIPVGSYDR